MKSRTFTDRVIERASRLVVLASLCGALAVAAYVGGATRPGLPLAFAATFAGAVSAGALWSGGVGVVLALGSVVPGLIAAVSGGRYPLEYQTLWIAALVGAMLGASRGTEAPALEALEWSLPARWRVPLVGWAVAVAMTWPLVVARETDFNASQLTSFALPTSSYGLRTPTTVLLIVQASMTLLAGIVWLDWLFAAFGQDSGRRFQRRVVAPMVGGAAIAAVVAMYQMFGRIAFLNRDFSVFGRAAGTLVDANAFGAIAAVCAGAIAAWAAMPGEPTDAGGATRGSSRFAVRLVVVPAGIALMLAGVWASGSKTSLVALLIVLAVIVRAWVRSGRALVPHGRRGVVAVGVGACVVALVLLVWAVRPQVLGATQRLWWIVPAPSGPSIRETLHAMWDRDGYGVAASRMLRQTPLFGVGVGSFPILVPDYGVSRFGGPLLPDNAQNWIRHQLTELGVLGSIGWLTWACAFGWLLTTARPVRDRALPAAIIRGVLAAVAIVSLVGMPTQNATLAIMVWTFVFWYSAQISPASPSSTHDPVSRKYWALAAVLVAVYVGGTWSLATGSLRVPMRARHFGWGYDYGFYFTGQNVRGGSEYRWAHGRAVAVLPAPSPVVKLTVWTNRNDVETNPLRARAWHDNRLVIDAVLRDTHPVTSYLVIRDPPPWFMLTTEVDRASLTKRLASRRDRDLGLGVEWTFLDQLPLRTDGSAWTPAGSRAAEFP